jgi:hypothetical protein
LYQCGSCGLCTNYRTFRLGSIRISSVLDERFARRKNFDIRACGMKTLENYPTNWHLKQTSTAPIVKVRARIPTLPSTIRQKRGDVDVKALLRIAVLHPSPSQPPVYQFRHLYKDGGIFSIYIDII